MLVRFFEVKLSGETITELYLLEAFGSIFSLFFFFLFYFMTDYLFVIPRYLYLLPGMFTTGSRESINVMF